MSRWDNEGGAGPDGSSAQFAAEHADIAPPDHGPEINQLHIRVIALENLVVALLAHASTPERAEAAAMASHIRPRAGFTNHPLTTHAAAHMLNLMERAEHFRGS